MDTPTKTLLSGSEVAKKLGVSRYTVRRYAEQGILKVALILPSGHARYDSEEVETLVKKLRSNTE